jgi:hypothetical protein
MCGAVEKGELDLNVTRGPELPFTEEDQNKYCLSFFTARTF